MAECLLAPGGAVDAPYLNVRSFRVDVDGLTEGCFRSTSEISANDQSRRTTANQIEFQPSTSIGQATCGLKPSQGIR